MSSKFKHGETVPSETLCARLNELSDAVAKGQAAVLREFDMRIPAELDRDADLVLSEAAMRIERLESQLAATQQRLAEAEELIDNTYAMGFYTIDAGSGLTHKDLCRKFAAMGRG